ncbi:MAG: L-threonylcarbamoyladenylate synthase [Mariprofundaceae bacterium]|nr:L-threonylcarbamoyladenylate synthase [Mariprofundaceae bacterium]
MATTFEHLRMHPDRPQIRQIRRAADMLQKGAFAVVPTETTYAIMMLPEALEAQTAVRQLRKLDQKHLWSLVVSDLSQAAQYVRMDNQAHRMLKRCLPGPYTFILPASSTLPKRVFGKRRDIGIRIPSHPICSMLLDELRQPLLATSMQLPEQEVLMNPDDMVGQLKHLHAVVMDAGWGGMMPTTIVDLCDGEAAVLRQGLGDWPYPS